MVRFSCSSIRALITKAITPILSDFGIALSNVMIVSANSMIYQNTLRARWTRVLAHTPQAHRSIQTNASATVRALGKQTVCMRARMHMYSSVIVVSLLASWSVFDRF